MIDYSQVISLFAAYAVPAGAVAFTFALGTKLIKSFITMGLGGHFKL